MYIIMQFETIEISLHDVLCNLIELHVCVNLVARILVIESLWGNRPSLNKNSAAFFNAYSQCHTCGIQILKILSFDLSLSQICAMHYDSHCISN